MQVPLKLGCAAEICGDVFMADACGCEGAEEDEPGQHEPQRAPDHHCPGSFGACFSSAKESFGSQPLKMAKCVWEGSVSHLLMQ